MALEDDFYTNRFGRATGVNNEREMLSHVTVDSPRTRQRLFPDGSETLLKTGAGIAKFITTEPKDEPDGKSYELVGEPMYRVVDAVTVPGAFLIKVVFGFNSLTTTLIPMDEYTGEDTTEEYLRYRRNNHWNDQAVDGNHARSLAGHRYTMHADRILSGYYEPFSLNETFEAFSPDSAWAYAIRNMLYSGVTRDWLLCSHGFSHWPTSTTVDAFPIPDWVGYGPATYWDDWYNIHRAHVFFTPNADLLVFCCYMPLLDTGTPPLRSLSSITTYDIASEELNTLLSESWSDTLTASKTATVITGAQYSTEYSSSLTATVDRVYPLSAVATNGNPDTVEAMSLEVTGTGVYTLDVAGGVSTTAVSSTLNIKWMLGTRVLHTRDALWSLDSVLTSGVSYLWGTTGFKCYEYGMLVCPEQQAYVLVETETAIPDFYWDSGSTPIPESIIRAYVFDARTNQIHLVAGAKTVGVHKLASASCLLPVGDTSNLTTAYSTVSVAASPVPAETSETDYHVGYGTVFESGSASLYNGTEWVDITPEIGSPTAEVGYCPFSFTETEANVDTGVVGSVVGTDDMIVVSARHPDRHTDSSWITPPLIDCTDYFLTFAINRKTGAVVTRATDDRGFANLYERMKVLP